MEFIFDNDRPIYLQLVEYLKLYIVSGKLQPGERLLSVRELALQIKSQSKHSAKSISRIRGRRINIHRKNKWKICDPKSRINKRDKETISIRKK